MIRALNTAQSSQIDRATYDPDKSELIIHFSSGHSYVYRQVTADVVKGLEEAESPGSFWHRHKARFPYEQL